MKKLLRNKKGFTLIELIVVILILAILAAILVPAILNYVKKAEDSKAQTNARSLYSEIAIAAAENAPGFTFPNGAYKGCTVGGNADSFTVQCTGGTGTFTFNGMNIVTP